MGSVIIAMPKSDDAMRIERIVQSRGLQFDTEICQTGSEVLRSATERDFGVVICTKRLKDMSYSELSEYLPYSFGMIVLTSDATLEVFTNHTVKLLMPFKADELTSTIEMLTAAYYRPRRKKKDHPAKVRSEAEQEIIDKAKFILMERNGMTEPEAFRYIQKTSMDTGRTSVETAEMILLMNDA